MANRKYEALVIGAGPGGYVAALRLAQLGKKTALVEKQYIGGVCLNVGCIPSKALITASKTYERMRHAESMGIVAKSISVDMEKLQAWKNGVVEKLTRGIRQLCKSAGVEILIGEASFVSERKIRVLSQNQEETIEAENIVIATGSVPAEIPGFKFDGKYILSSTEAQELKSVPSKMIVIGGGYIGMELGMMYAKLGTKVTVVEMLDQLLPGFEEDIVRVITRQVKKQGIDYYLRAKAKSWKQKEGAVEVTIETQEGARTLDADFILLTVGRKPYIAGLQLEKAGIQTDARGFIPVNDKLQTHVPGIYAIGDVIGNPMLAHKASKEGEIAAEVIAGLPSAADYVAMPAVVFTDPEIATVGLSEKEAREKGYDLIVGKFPFAASGRAMTTLETEGFIKVVVDKESKRLLGFHIVGPEASDMISEGALALEMASQAEDVARTIHPHPTLSEALMEAVKDSLGEAVHIAR